MFVYYQPSLSFTVYATYARNHVNAETNEENDSHHSPQPSVIKERHQNIFFYRFSLCSYIRSVEEVEPRKERKLRSDSDQFHRAPWQSPKQLAVLWRANVITDATVWSGLFSCR